MHHCGLITVLGVENVDFIRKKKTKLSNSAWKLDARLNTDTDTGISRDGKSTRILVHLKTFYSKVKLLV